MKIAYENEILTPPEMVFPWIAEPEKAIQWQKDVKGYEILIRKPEMIGTTFKEVIEEDGNALEMHGAITQFMENKMIGFHLQSRIHEFDVLYYIEATKWGTKIIIEATIKWKFPMNLISLFIGKKMKAGILEQLGSEVRELKRICETG